MLKKKIIELSEVIAARTTREPNTAEIHRLEEQIMKLTAVISQVGELDLALEALGLPRKECCALIYPIIERLDSLGNKEVPNC